MKPDPVKRAPDIRCPGCGAKFSDGGEFEIVIPYKAASSNEVAGFDAHGAIRLGYGDMGNPTRFGRPELTCGTCGHAWTTTRRWA